GPGAPDVKPFQYGGPGWLPVAGHWSGAGKTAIGVVDPSTATWYLRNSASPGGPDTTPFRYGAAGWSPVVGDWDGDGQDTIGVVAASGKWYLRNQNGPGGPAVQPFAYGAPGWRSLSGAAGATGPYKAVPPGPDLPVGVPELPLTSSLTA